MKFITLIENTSTDKEYISNHGLSLYIETAQSKLLMDCGPDNGFIKNASKLGIDLSSIDFLIISHFHYDHSGGLKYFLRINNHAKVLLSNKAFDEYYAVSKKNQMLLIGLDKNLSQNKQIVLVDDEFQISDNINVVGNFNYKFDNPLNDKFYKKQNGNLIVDDFSHEIALIIKEYNKNILISGCFHSGVINMIEKTNHIIKGKTTHVIGGFHLAGRDERTVSKEYIIRLTRYLSENNIKCYTGHCTGKIGYDELKKNLNDKIHYIATGSEFII